MLIRWIEANRAMLLPRPGVPLPERSLRTDAEARAAVGAAIPLLRPGGKEAPKAAAAFTEGIARLAALSAGGPVGTAEEEGLSYALLWGQAPSALEALIDLWFSGPGAAFALEAWQRSLEWRYTAKDKVLTHDSEIDAYRTKFPGDHILQRRSRYLRLRLCEAPLSVGEAFGPLAAKLDPCRAAGLAWHVPEVTWAEGVAKRLFAAKPPSYYEGHLPSPGAHIPLLAGLRLPLRVAAQVAGRVEPGDALDLLDRCGAEGWPIIAAACEHAAAYGSVRVPAVDRILAMVEDPPDLAALPILLSYRSPEAERLLRADPPKALRALYAAATAWDQRRPTVIRMIHALLDADPALPPATGLDVAAQAQQQRVLAERREGLAAEADLPEWINHPPWEGMTQRKKAREAEKIQLTPIELPLEVEPFTLARFKRATWRSFDERREQDIVDDLQTFINTGRRLEKTGFFELSYCTEATIREFFRPEAVGYFLPPDAHNYHIGNLRWLVLQWIHWAGADVLPLAVALMPRLDQDELQIARRFGHPAFAPKVLAIYLRRRRERKEALAWMLRFPRHAAAAAIPVLLGGKNPREGDRAVRPLWTQARATVEEVARRYEEASGRPVLAEIAARMAIDPLQILPATLPKPSVSPAEVPALQLKGTDGQGGRFLGSAAMEVALMFVQLSSPEDPYPGLDLLKEACTARSLGELTEALWSDYKPSPGALAAAAAFGSDALARRMSRALRNDRKPTDVQINTVLRTLLAMGSDTALIELGRLAERALKEKVKASARKLLHELAAERGLSDEELADRLVPDLDLGADGGMILDFGPRQFRVGLSETLAPFLMDASGNRLPRFPAANKLDEKDKVKEATARWKALVKDLDALAATQLARIERAMCEGRAWDREGFESLFLAHPLLQHPGRRLLWRAAPPEGPAALFRVAEDGSLADAGDAPLTLPEECAVTLPHPADLTPEELTAWGQIFSDYQILQPFPQIGRTVYTITEAEAAPGNRGFHDRCAGISAPATILLGVFDRAGWKKWDLEYGQHLHGWHRSFGAVHASISANPHIDMDDLTTRHTVLLTCHDPLNTLSKRDFSEIVRPIESLRR